MARLGTHANPKQALQALLTSLVGRLEEASSHNLLLAPPRRRKRGRPLRMGPTMPGDNRFRSGTHSTLNTATFPISVSDIVSFPFEQSAKYPRNFLLD